MEKEFINELVRALQNFKGELARTFITDERLNYALRDFKNELDLERSKRNNELFFNICKVLIGVIIGLTFGMIVSDGKWQDKYNDKVQEIQALQKELRGQKWVKK